MMRVSLSAACKPVHVEQPLVKFPGGLLNLEAFIPRRRKEKVVVVIGATGTGKSRLSIDLANRFEAEIVNSDKMQVYDGLDILTNKVTEEERRAVPHHLLAFLDPNADDFTAADFRHHASQAVDSIISRHRLPIIAGGSNSCIKALVCDDVAFRSGYECCFLWVDVALPVLNSFVSDRVDRMVEAGLVDEVRSIFDPNADYSRGIRRAIGVPEMDPFLRSESPRALTRAIHDIKSNTRKLARRQLQNILRLHNLLDHSRVLRLDATQAFVLRGQDSDQAWEELVVGPAATLVSRFLFEDSFLTSTSVLTAATAVTA